MRFTFTLYDIQQITSNAYSTAFRAFIPTFRYQSEESDSDFNYDNSDSDLSDFWQMVNKRGDFGSTIPYGLPKLSKEALSGICRK